MDGRILAFGPLPNGPLQLAGPELRTGSSLLALDAAVPSADPGRYVVAAACQDRSIRV